MRLSVVSKRRSMASKRASILLEATDRVANINEPVRLLAHLTLTQPRRRELPLAQAASACHAARGLVPPGRSATASAINHAWTSTPASTASALAAPRPADRS